MRALGYLSLLSRVREISDTRHTRPDGGAAAARGRGPAATRARARAGRRAAAAPRRARRGVDRDRRVVAFPPPTR